MLSYAPDDEEGGWVEPFVGFLNNRVETLIASHLRTRPTHGLRHTLLIGSTRWAEHTLPRQPAHTRSEALEVVNSVLRWWDVVCPEFERRFAGSEGSGQLRLRNLDRLFNTANDQASHYLRHQLHWAMRGVAIRHLYAPKQLNDALDFHRRRMLESGFWEVYGEQVRAFVMDLLD